MSETPKLVYEGRDLGWQLPSRPSDVECRIETLRDEIAELRAILAPLLDAPLSCNDADQLVCPFCFGHSTDLDEDHFRHASDCPVLRKDALLGR